MGALLNLLVGSFTSIFAYLGAKLAAKFGIQLALVAVFITAAAAFAVTMNTLGGALVGTMPAVVQTGMTYLPSAIGPAVSAVVGGETAAYVYRQIVIVASIKSRI